MTSESEHESSALHVNGMEERSLNDQLAAQPYWDSFAAGAGKYGVERNTPLSQERTASRFLPGPLRVMTSRDVPPSREQRRVLGSLQAHALGI
jgi:hypothetical protein